MEAGIRHGGGNPGLGGFYSTRATWRCGGGSMADSGGRFNVSVTGVEGSREEGKQRGRPLPKGKAEEAVMLHDVVVHDWLADGDDRYEGGRGEKLGRLVQLSLDYQVKRNAGLKM
jgi:hypothetical protein